MKQEKPHTRHAVLFELLRQQNLAEETTHRVNGRRSGINRGEALLLQTLASASFRPLVQ